MHILPQLEAETTMNITVTDNTEPISRTVTPAAPGYSYPYPISFQVLVTGFLMLEMVANAMSIYYETQQILSVSVTGFLMLEMVLGLSSNLTVLALYCMKSNLISSVSNVVTMNLHVLDVVVCTCCIPLTITVVLLSIKGDTALVCCFHEACVSFTSVATAVNLLAITLDRYDISVKPANRVLTMGRALGLLAAIWVLSLVSFLVPFMEYLASSNLERSARTAEERQVGFYAHGGGAEVNRTVALHAKSNYHTEPVLYYHLLAQIPIFLFTAVVMLVTYSKILQALNFRIGARFHHHASQKKKNKMARSKKRPSMTAMTASSDDNTHAAGCQNTGDDTTTTTTGGGGGGGGAGRYPALGMRTSVSVIIALRRAVKRHRERRERQKRVFRMSLLIVSTFLLCWSPITVLNAVILVAGYPSDVTARLRLAFLVMAYGTTVFHPLLYAFTRQKFQKVLQSKMKKRVVSITEAEPLPANAVIHNSWIDPKRNKTVVTFEPTDNEAARQKCLVSSEDAE